MRGKTVIITGASSGIGAELAVALAARGANVVLAARGEELLAQVKQRCEQGGGHALVVPTDVSDPESCRRMVERSVEAFGGIDSLVNNAGLAMSGGFEEVTDLSVFERVMRVNYLGAVFSTHHALPHLKARRGLLVAVSSLAGKSGMPLCSAYAASKYAMQGLFDSLRMELGDSGVDVLVVSPGFVATGILERALGPDGVSHPGKGTEAKANKIMDARTCAGLILRAMERRQREVMMLPAAKLVMVLKALVPGFVDHITARTVKKQQSADVAA